ncbi:MAG: hypothetical protein R3B47_18100 [Bacteroidia bacterium]
MRFPFFIFVIAILIAGSCDQAASHQEKEPTSSLDFQEARRMLAEGKKLVLASDSLHQGGEEVLAEQKAAEAVAKLQDLISKAPDYRNAAVALLGQAAFINRDYQNAKMWLEEAVGMDGRDVKSLMWLGLSHLATSQPDTAQGYFARSINFYDEVSHRERMVREIYKVGITAFEYGVSHEQDGYPQKGFDYKVYGTYVVSMAWELDKNDSMPELKGQILTYAKALLPQAKERNDTARIQFFENIITQLQ